MASINKAKRVPVLMHQGGSGQSFGHEVTLERLVSACMLWEDTFYMDGKSIVDLIKETASKCPLDYVLNLAVKNRQANGIRHASVLLLVAAIEMAEKAKLEGTQKSIISEAIFQTCKRPDDLTEMVALYWGGAKKTKPLTWQMKKGIAKCLNGYSEYQVAKYCKRGEIRLRDLLFMAHVSPSDAARASLFANLSNDTLAVPDSWEVAISAASPAEKANEWKRLFKEGRLGDLALLRNLRNLHASGVSHKDLILALEKVNPQNIFPFQLVTAANIMPEVTAGLDAILQGHDFKKDVLFKGNTVIFVDVSGSMGASVSAKSVARRADAASSLAIQFAKSCESFRIIPYGTQAFKPYTGNPTLTMAREISRLPGGGTNTYAIVSNELGAHPNYYDRVVILTDEQAGDLGRLPDIGVSQWVVNLGTYANGLSYGKWNTINGFSSNTVRFVAGHEGLTFHGAAGED